MVTCAVSECARESIVRGYCRMHYTRWRSHGDPLVVKGTPRGLTPEERFMRHVSVEPNTGCWVWTGASREGRYGAFNPGDGSNRMVAAHRWIYEQTVGPIPAGLQMDHFHCGRTMCVNPRHVRPVTARENTLRSTGPASANLAKTHCDRGHEFSELNTRIWHGERICRTCARENTARYVAEGRQQTPSTRTHCREGHEFTIANTRYEARTGKRVCRACHALVARRSRQRRNSRS